MKLRFGIREKLALVAIVLVLAASFILPALLFKHTIRVVEDHELVDLQDEAELRCWSILDSISLARSGVEEWAKGPLDAPSETTLNSGPSKLPELLRYLENPAEIRAAAAAAAKAGHNDPGPPLWWDTIFAVWLLLESGAPEQPFTARGITPPAIPAQLLAASRERPGSHVSAILPCITPMGFNPHSVSVQAPNVPQQYQPVIWVLAASHEEPGKVLAVLVSLDIGRSPRHLSVLLNAKGEFLLHPFVNAESLTPAKLYQDFDFLHQAKILTEGGRWSGQASGTQTQRGTLTQKQPLAMDFQFMEGTVGDKLMAALKQDDDTQRQDYQRWAEKLRMELESTGCAVGFPSTTARQTRLLARDESTLRAARKRLEEAFVARYPEAGGDLKWRQQVRCANGDIQLMRFFLRQAPEDRPDGPHAPDAPYYFAYATFREELASSIEHEVSELRRFSIFLALGSGVGAFLVALYFVRPLSKITATAYSVSHSGSVGPEFQNQINAVRSSLPVRRRDEVGEIARALENLLRQVLNGHEQLRQANADLDTRVHQRTYELSEKRRELEMANEQLRGLAAAKDAFLASVSHELRQPLNSIFGFLQFLEMSELDPQQQADLKRLRDNAAYLRRLIDDILDYQKIIMGGLELEPEAIEAATFFRDLQSSLRNQAEERNNTLEFIGTDGLGTLRNDKGRLRQVLVNLLSNACKFTHDGQVSLIARRLRGEDGRDWLIFHIKDTGRGMKPEEMDGLFHVRFKKLSSREGNKSGTGLGLVIVRGLCDLMGGSITCASTFGKGSTFTVRIPAEIGQAGPAQIFSEPTAIQKLARPSDTLPAPHSLVLVIDDDPSVRELMCRFLESKGYTVMTAGDGEQGIALARERRPAVITLDVVLPGSDGWTILSQLKADPATARIPVIMVSFLEETKRGYALGAADFVVKPIAWDSLLHSVQKLAVGYATPGPVLVIDDDHDAREIYRRTLARDGFEVAEASDGAAALSMLSWLARPCVIILDLMMPNLDGFGFIEAFSQNPEWRGIPIIVATAKHPTAEDRQRLTGNVQAILEKGALGQEDLLEEILRLVHRHVPKIG